MRVAAYVARAAGAALAPFTIDRRDPGPRDVAIDALFCGVCHSDVHQARDEWGGGIFPMVPGHEIVGRVTRVGREATRFKAGDLVGVGCMVDSCGRCEHCRAGTEQFCVEGVGAHLQRHGDGPEDADLRRLFEQLVVQEHFVVRIPEGLDPAAAAPLLCAGVTT